MELDFEVMQRNLVLKHTGLKTTCNLDAYEQKAWVMRQSTTLNAEDQQVLYIIFRGKWKKTQHQYKTVFADPTCSKQPLIEIEAMTRAWNSGALLSGRYGFK